MMSRHFVLFAALSLLLIVHYTSVCNGRATGTKEDELAALAKRLRELIADKEHDASEENEDTEDTSGEHADGSEESEDSEEHEGEDSKHSQKKHDVVHNKVQKSSSKHHSRQSGLTEDQKRKVVDIHNKLRKGEQGSNMYKLKYNDNLARLAQEWADRCAWGHRPHGSFNPGDYGFKSVGENIWAWSDDSKDIPDAPIADWFNEKNYYNYDGLSCSKEPCGHYTQVVWHSTQEVGCGLTKCGTLSNAGMNNANFFVCNYGPGGNMQGEKPYKKGNACSQCSAGQFYCTEQMCDASCNGAGGGGNCECKANCVHGTVTSDCRCQCDAGSSGSDCSESCENKNPQCGANPGWPENFCHDKTIFGGMMYDMVNEQCPKMCKKCGSKKRENEELEFLAILKERMDDDKK